jgi:hypothetical protein
MVPERAKIHFVMTAWQFGLRVKLHTDKCQAKISVKSHIHLIYLVIILLFLQSSTSPLEYMTLRQLAKSLLMHATQAPPEATTSSVPSHSNAPRDIGTIVYLYEF